MRQRWKLMKRWKKWTISIVGSILLIILAAAGYLYYEIKSINLADIEKRIEEKKQDSNENHQDTALPSVLTGTVEKASELAGKPIDGQDALDVASILLKSGLSMKEMYYLMGKSTDKLSNEEKQKIRDMLLAKLSEDEIKALRTITYDYGKGLNILDPNFPIELIGVYDEAEYKRIEKELEEKKKAQNSPSPTGTPSASPSPSSGGSDGKDSEVSPTPSTDSGAEAAALRDKYQTKLNSLQASCTNKVNGIASEISADLKAGQNSDLAALQKKYLPRIEAAESECDAQFNQLMDEAKKEYDQKGFPLNDVSIWESQYKKAKQDAQNQALSSLMSAMSK